MKWKLFLEGHRFTTINCDGTFEVDTKKLDLNAFIEGTQKINKEHLYFLRIGILKSSFHRKIEMQKDPNYGRMITTTPRLGGLHLQQTIFLILIEPILMNYLFDNASEEGKNDRVEDDDENDDNEDDNDDDNENGTSSQYKSKNKKPKYNAQDDDDDSMDNFDMAKSYPHLARALEGKDGFDPTNPSV